MRPRENIIFLICFSANIGYIMNSSEFPSKLAIQNWAKKMNADLTILIRNAANFDAITEAYTRQISKINRYAVGRMSIVEEVSKKLSKTMNMKMASLEKSVKAAEEAAANHRFMPFLKISDVDYVTAKGIDDNDTRFEYSSQFQQKVALNFSSVHIPVEIYEGAAHILNSLNWSSKLDEQWMKNKEEDPSLLWQFFGSNTGFMRTLPASKWKGDIVDLYDVRRRPWYTQGTSSPKDMMILIDTSGSTHGQALALMKVAVKSLLDTLGENDFVYIAAFSEEIHNVSCFKTFVQANYRNKKLLSKSVDNLKAGGMAMHNVAFEFAFNEISKFRREARDGQGAQCNQVIMLLTDGGTEMPTDVFKRHNWPEQPVRVFTYAIGPTANPIASVKWMACSNRGYFFKIPAMGAIRTRVQEYVGVLGRVTALAKHPDRFQWNDIKDDPHGLGMMTTVTLPVYDRGLAPGDPNEQRRKNQTILGVMGVDVTVKEMEEQIPRWKLGPNGYGFAINANGYIVFHPYLKSGEGYLKNPPNVDFLDVEIETPAKELIRHKMIDKKADEDRIETTVISRDELHVTKLEMWYSYMPIQGTSFSLGITVPVNHEFFIDIKDRRVNTGDDELLENLKPGKSATLISSWEYCKNITDSLLRNVSISVNTLLDLARSKPEDCRSETFRHLLYDALVTKHLATSWESYSQRQDMQGHVDAYFVATGGGLTRVYPASQEEAFQPMRGTTLDAYYQRAFNFREKYVFSAPNAGFPGVHEGNKTNISILGLRTIKIDDKKPVYPAVAGIKIKHEWFELQWSTYCQNPEGHVCYLLDDGGFLISTSHGEPETLVGMFFGDVDRAMMSVMFDRSIYGRLEHFDHQAICPKRDDDVVAAGRRSLYMPSLTMFYDAMNVGWWTSRMSWTYLRYNIYNWAFSAGTVDAYSAEEEEMHTNISCIKKYAYYYYSDVYSATGMGEYSYSCRNCSRRFVVHRFPDTNLLFVVAEPECPECSELFAPLQQKPIEDSGPDICQAKLRYRARPGDCHSGHDDEYTKDCGSNGKIHVSLLTIIAVFLVHLLPRRHMLLT